ncbi:metal-dependent hydrolase [Mycobacterium paraterrae]|uniref:Metal-dependent hydrolase n=1 Tax=Mycobacterium paraterrae TaxID=577492 RepID=A0ABY3VK11_9MYCO|nr:metal-dependent hydrolase [Mycobacterium paraterrae]UMB68812.1 metal-dependent hydrolase [Mycobacterium paraterrae]
MTHLVIRKIPWDFEDAGVPFKWQPDNPNFGLFCNAFTFIAVPFERYIVNVVRRAADAWRDDPDVAAEADAFLRQEAQHASAHRKHMLALVQRYPELEWCYVDACRAYDRLLDEQPIEFHAAYIANLEATFTPLFKVFLDNRDSLFGGGDQRVASLMMWHFVEEIEHRSSGLILYRHISPNPWYRTRRIRDTFAHVSAVAHEIAKAFDEVVPFEDRGASAQELMSISLLYGEFMFRGPGGRRRRAGRGGPPTLFSAVPTRELLAMVWRLVLSQAPNHDPADQPLPEWADTWMREYDHGVDMTRFFPTTTR